jgi:hypothetical protein
MDEVDGTYEVERAHMTGCALTENTPTKLLEQLTINENLSALNAQWIRPVMGRSGQDSSPRTSCNLRGTRNYVL